VSMWRKKTPQKPKQPTLQVGVSRRWENSNPYLYPQQPISATHDITYSECAECPFRAHYAKIVVNTVKEIHVVLSCISVKLTWAHQVKVGKYYELAHQVMWANVMCGPSGLI
jgi:hypothetical protein